jgi:hypothetical protein
MLARMRAILDFTPEKRLNRRGHKVPRSSLFSGFSFGAFVPLEGYFGNIPIALIEGQ